MGTGQSGANLLSRQVESQNVVSLTMKYLKCFHNFSLNFLVDGNWTEWSNFTDCSLSCGNGTRDRFRYCTNPMPMHGGEYCLGENNEREHCNEDPCPGIRSKKVSRLIDL